jgi:hypothetical protein
MKTTRQGHGSRQLVRAVRCIERWRGERVSRKETIPDYVWSAAAEAARVDGVWVASRALRLEFNRLKERVFGARTGPAVRATVPASARTRRARRRRPLETKQLVPRSAGFVEVVVDPVRELGASGAAVPGVGSTWRPGATGSAVIELMGRNGERMRIEVACPTAVDLLGLSQAFWSRQP